jgi:hypothetical protein
MQTLSEGQEKGERFLSEKEPKIIDYLTLCEYLLMESCTTKKILYFLQQNKGPIVGIYKSLSSQKHE